MDAGLVPSKPGSGAGPLERQASLGSDGYWHVDSVPILLPGRWHLRIEVETLFRKIAFRRSIKIARFFEAKRPSDVFAP